MTTYRNFHEGEARLQAQSGVDTAAFDLSVDQSFQPELNNSEVTFIGKRTFSVAASLDDQGRPWASPLVGAAGELFTVEDPSTVRIRARRTDGDPLIDNINATADMGVLYFNPAIRRRAKSLGRGVVETDGSITYRMHRMFGLCPKYIFKRTHDASPASEQPAAAPPTTSDRLSEQDRQQLGQTDTIFLASQSQQHGTDATHRGGPPGFVTVINDSTLTVPDYIGNGMYQTLGNLLLDDRIGLLSIDFATGRIVQITGRGSITDAEPNGVETERALHIEIENVKTSTADIGSWTDVEAYSVQ